MKLVLKQIKRSEKIVKWKIRKLQIKKTYRNFKTSIFYRVRKEIVLKCYKDAQLSSFNCKLITFRKMRSSFST